MSSVDKKLLLRAIDIIDSLDAWDDSVFKEQFGVNKSQRRKEAMMEIREILNRN